MVDAHAATAAVTAFAKAVALTEAAAAHGVCDDAAWATRHGDSPQRLFRKASDPRRGYALQVGEATAGEDGRAAVQVDLTRADARLGGVWLLGRPAPDSDADWRITGVCKVPSWRDAFLRGQVPALLDYAAMPTYPAAADGVVALCALGQRAVADTGDARDMLTALMNEDDAAAAVVARLQALITSGAQIRVVDSRWLPRLGRAVVRAEAVFPGVARAAGVPDQPTDAEPTDAEPTDSEPTDSEPTSLWIHAEAGPPLSWLLIEETLRAEALTT